jgi:hypothetical protein
LHLRLTACILAFTGLVPSAAVACDLGGASAYLNRCVAANDAGDNVTKSVYCASAAQEFGVCALENNGRLHFGFLAFEGRALSLAGAANVQGGLDAGKGRLQIQSAKGFARSVLASKAAEPKARIIARNTLDDISKLHL